MISTNGHLREQVTVEQIGCISVREAGNIAMASDSEMAKSIGATIFIHIRSSHPILKIMI